MTFDPKDLETLAASLIEKGLPALGGLIGGPVGAAAGNVVAGVVGQIATSFGLAPDAAPAEVAAAVAADPQAADKLAALEEKHKAQQDSAQQQVDQNNAELAVQGPLALRLFYGGWRPAMGWLSGPLLLLYQIAAHGFGLPPVPDAITNWGLSVWVILAGARSFEKWQGVSAPGPVVASPATVHRRAH